MRPADINRVKRAKEHLKAAVTLLTSIKWENVSAREYDFIMQSKVVIKEADMHLDDIINIQEA